MMFMILALGYALHHTGFIDDHGASQLSDLVLYVANPALIAQALMRDFDPALLVGAGWVVLFTVVTLAISCALGAVAYRPNGPHGQMGRFAVTFSNAGFIGIPLAMATVGPDGVFYISIANTVQTVLLWTYGAALASGDHSAASPKRVLTNPAIIAMAAGFVCFLASWQPPAVVGQAVDALGAMNTGLVMLVLGAHLDRCDVGRILSSTQIYKVGVLRLVAMPLLTFAVLVAASGSVKLDAAVWASLVLYQAMPVATVASLFAHKYDTDGPFSSGVVAATTLLSAVTLPLALTFLMA